MTGKAFFIRDSLPEIQGLARRAGDAILRHYKTGLTVERKSDASPVTEADREADRIIVQGLKRLTPEISIVSEEGEQLLPEDTDWFWLVDPLDGTKSFIRGSGAFTVNIALVGPQKLPVMGVVFDPVQDALYWGSAEGAFRVRSGGVPEPLRCRAPAPERIAVVSHSRLNAQTEAYLASFGPVTRVPCASSLKFCILAEGDADLYPRFGPTMEWDTAAGHAVLQAAGGRMTTPEGAPFLYGKPGLLNGNFIACGLA